MELILTGKMIDAKEALQFGLVSSVHPDDQVFNVALQTAEKIASFSKPVITLAKNAVDTAENIGLSMGLEYERRVFEGSFALDDKREGMSAFVEKRPPVW